MPIRVAYCRYLGDKPESSNTAIAEHGFDELGIKCIPFQGFGDIDTSVDCGPEALICGFISDVYAGLKKLGLPQPPSIDYPWELGSYYNRRIWTGTLDHIQDRGIHPGVFVKPKDNQKLFTGFVWNGTAPHRLRLAPYPKDTPVYFSDPINLVSEYRSYILDGELLGVKHYQGDWSIAPSREIVQAAVAAYRPYRAFAIDFGITDTGKTIVVEVNDAFALGNYGLPSRQYARMLEARWEELTGSLNH